MIGPARRWLALRRRRSRASTVPLLLLVASLLLTGCGSHAQDLGRVREALIAGNLEEAGERFDARQGKESDLLALLEHAHLLHLRRQWAASNHVFEAAEVRADELFTRSISRQAAALVTSDNVLPYRGATYELQLVQFYRALNYLALEQPDEALVEARKANEVLDRVAAGETGEPTYRQNPFLHYVTGLLYDSRGEVNDAVVSYRDAYRLYQAAGPSVGLPPPSWLRADYLDAARRVGLGDEVRALTREQPSPPAGAGGAAKRNLIVFFESGFVPFRQPVDIFLPIFEEDDEDHHHDPWDRADVYVNAYSPSIYAYSGHQPKLDRVLRFSFPRLERFPSAVASCELILPDGEAVRAEPALELEAVARAEFEDDLPLILLRTVARALAKEWARHSGEKQTELLGELINLINIATEQADTRGWILLPRRISLAMASLPEGAQTVQAYFRDAYGNVVEEVVVDVELYPGETRFVALRSFQ